MVQGCPRQHVLEIDREQQLELCPSRTVTFSHAEQSDVAAQKGGRVGTSQTARMVFLKQRGNFGVIRAVETVDNGFLPN